MTTLTITDKATRKVIKWVSQALSKDVRYREPLTRLSALGGDLYATDGRIGNLVPDLARQLNLDDGCYTMAKAKGMLIMSKVEGAQPANLRRCIPDTEDMITLPSIAPSSSGAVLGAILYHAATLADSMVDPEVLANCLTPYPADMVVFAKAETPMVLKGQLEKLDIIAVCMPLSKKGMAAKVVVKAA